jgi:uncharacterized membrane protein (DUF485 family)
MLHEPAHPQEKDYAPGYKTRLGVWMFLLYALVYVGFLAINLVSPKAMAAQTPIFGLNVASAYGFGLILFALVLALIYNLLCTRKEDQLRKLDKARDKEQSS